MSFDVSRDVRLTRLASGLTVVTDTMPHVATVSIGVHVGAGSRDEAENEHGISHLLEHMAFKGTGRRTAREIAEEIESVGGDINAYTSSESTAYHAQVLAADMPLAVDILHDILADPSLDDAELAREKNVIVQEIGAVEDSPDSLVFDKLQTVSYPGQPIGRPILGTVETVESFTPADVRAYLARHYRAPDMVVTAAGAVDHDAFLAEVGKRFASFGTEAGPKPAKAAFGGGVTVEGRDLEQLHIAFAIEGVSLMDDDFPAARVFTTLFGGGSSSRLFQEVREKRGLCYACWAAHYAYADTGQLMMYAGTDPEDATDLVEVTLAELDRAAREAEAKEVAKAKAQLKTGLLMALESSSARADQLARQLLVFGRLIPLAEIVAKIDAVDVDQVRVVGQKLVNRATPAFAALGPQAGVDAAAAALHGFRRAA